MIARTAVALALAAVLFVPEASSFQSTEGPGWAESWDQAVEEAMVRNVPIFISIQQDNNPACTAMEGAFRDGSFIKGIQRVVPVVANGEVGHGTREMKIGGQKVAMCKIYEGIKCDAHSACNVVAGMFFKGEFGLPSQVWVKYDEKSETRVKEIFRVTGPNGTGQQGASDILKDMERALGNIVGKSISRKEFLDGKKLAAMGNELAQKNEFKKSIEVFKKLKDSKSEFFAKQGDQALQELQVMGKNMVENAVAAAPQNPKEAKEILNKVIKEFDPTWECVKMAKEQLAKIK